MVIEKIKYFFKIYRRPSIDWIEYKQILQGLNQDGIVKRLIEIEKIMEEAMHCQTLILKNQDRNYTRYLINEAEHNHTESKLKDIHSQMNEMMREIRTLIVEKRGK
jgi:hypothetical protein